MQCVETDRALASLDRELIEKAVLRLLDRRSRNDLAGMLEVVDPNVVYEMRGSHEVYPYFGRREGIEEIRRMLDRIATDFENKGSRVHRILIDGSNVAVERTATLRHRGTGAQGDVDIVNFLRFDRGLVVEISELADAAALDRLVNPPPPMRACATECDAEDP